MKRSHLLTLLAVLTLLLCCILPTRADAATTVASGSCGDNVTYVLDSNGVLTISGNGAMKDYTSFSSVPWYSKRASIKMVVIEDGVTSISYEAFYNCSSLTSITIPDSVTSVGDYAFRNCSSLTYNVYDNAKYLGNSKNPYMVLVSCVSEDITSCTIHEDTKLINFEAFRNCSSLTSITIPEGVTGIGDNAFRDCNNLTSITIPDSVTSIGLGAFYGCSKLTSITISDSVTSIGNYAFRNCTGLKKVSFGKDSQFTSIGNYVFYGCSSLTSITIPDNVTSIGNYAFQDCSSLTSIAIPDSVTSIGIEAFYNCDNLTSVHITDIAAWCGIFFDGYYGNPLYYAKNLYLNGTLVRDMVIPSGVIGIGSYAFYNCKSLTSVSFGENSQLTSIGSSAFYNCSYLSSITIPSSVTTIGSSAFSGCSGLTGVYITDLTAWCNIKFDDSAANPCVDKLYLNNQLIEELVIPNGVTSVGDYAFRNCSSLTSVTIPSSVTNIGNSAFFFCSNLSSITIPSSVTTIGSSAFYYCHSLTSITIPSSVISIGLHAFYDCSGLTSVTFSKNSQLTSIGEAAFSSCGSLTGITIPEGVTSIGAYAFYGCDSLTSIDIPNSVTDIGKYAFSGCSSLTYKTSHNAKYLGNSQNPYAVLVSSTSENITSCWIHSDTRVIYGGAFSGCDRLTKITIPSSVISIGYSAFSDCSYLTGVYITDLTAWCNIKFDGSSANPLFYAKRLYLNNQYIIVLEIPNGVTEIGAYAFYNCSSLTGVTLPDTVTSIGSYAFYNCSSLTSITIPDSVTSISYYAFSGCDSLTYNTYNNAKYLGNSQNPYVALVSRTSNNITSCEIHPNTRVICDIAFYNCSYLSSVTIPDSVTSIGAYAFRDCNNLTSITIPDSVTSIGDSAFYYCSSLAKVTFGDNSQLASIGDRAFVHCSSLPSITIPEGVTSIGKSAFYGCDSLTSITIPDSVTSIGESAFYGCDSLTSITIPDSVTSIGESAFQDCRGLTGVYITDLTAWCNIKFDGSAANPLFYAKKLYLNNRFVEVLKIPNGVTSIGDYAFCNCSSLTGIEIPDSVTSIGDRAFIWCNIKKLKVADGSKYVKKAMVVCKGTLTEVEIPSSVTSIGSSAFSCCGSLTSVTFSRSSQLTSIGYSAFQDCSSLTSITIPSSVTSIGEAVFRGCSSLESMTIPFVGDSKKTARYPFGYIFGTHSYTGGVAIEQFISGSISNTYYIPSSLKSVTVTDGEILFGAFRNCSSLTSITIPSSITSIGSYAFAGCSNLPSITIPSSVTSIGSYAFYNCSNLPSITIPDSVTSIGSYAFAGCSNLPSITIPSSVTSIGSYAFAGCSSLIGVHITDMAAWCGISFDASYGNPLLYAKNLYLNGTLVTDVVIPSSVTSIGAYAFAGCSSLTSVTFSKSSQLTSIGNYAFSDCTSLISITIPDSVISIGLHAFDDCSGLTSVTFSKNSQITSIGNYAFKGCERLTSVTFGENSQLTGIGDRAFYGCSSLVFNVYDNAKYLGNETNAYYALIAATATDITNCTIHKDTKVVAMGAFYGCGSLKSMVIPFVGGSKKTASDSYQYPFGYIFGSSGYTGGVATKQSYYGSSTSEITSNTYYIPSSLKSVTVTDGEILYGAFYNCRNLTSVSFGENSQLTSIGEAAFSGCYDLISITIPDSVTSVGREAFYGCSSLSYNTYDNGIYLGNSQNPYVILVNTVSFGMESCQVHARTKVICDSAFSGWIWLTSVTFGENSQLTSIGDYAFRDCSSLTSITIPSSVTSIGSYAFAGCSNLPSITIPSSVTSIGYEAFYGCERLTSVTFGENSQLTGIGDYAFRDCSSLTSITIPSGVTSIGEYAFADCSSLSYNTYDNAKYLGNSKNPYVVLVSRVSTDITSCTIHEDTKFICSDAFRDCSSLTSITIPSGVTSIGENVFAGCSSLSYNTYDNAKYLGNSKNPYVVLVSRVSTDITSCTIHEDTKFIYSDAFQNCSSLTSITIPDSVTSIGGRAFSYCYNLTSITIPDGVTSIGDYVFNYCARLTSITIPNSVTRIGYRAFEDCISLKDVYYTGVMAQWNVIQIEGVNTNLTDVAIHTHPTFGSCGDNLAWWLSDDWRLTIFGTGAMTAYATPNDTPWYKLRSYIKEIWIDDEVTSISEGAFSGFSNLTHITLPSPEKHLGYIFGQEEYSGSYAVTPQSAVRAVTRYYIPISLKAVTIVGGQLPGGAFYNCSSLTTVTLDDGVTAVGKDAFTGCTALENLYYYGKRSQWTQIIGGNDIGLSADTAVNTLETIISRIDIKTMPTKTEYWSGQKLNTEGLTITVTYTTGSTKTISSGFAVTGFDSQTVGTKTLTVTYEGKTTTFTVKVKTKTSLTITKQPKNLVTKSGQAVSLSVVATGADLSYQWYRREPGSTTWTAFTAASAKTANFEFTAYNYNDGRQYKCVITDFSGEKIESDIVSLSMWSITQQPQSVIAFPKETVTMRMATNVTEGLTYLWYRQEPGSTTWTAFTAASAKTPEFTFTAETYMSGRRYKCVVTDAYGNKEETEVVTLSVWVVNQQPQNTVVLSQESATMSVGTNVTEGLTYQWYYQNAGADTWTAFNGTNNPTAKTANFTFTAETYMNGRRYKCIVTDANGNQTETNVATLTVWYLTQQPKSIVTDHGKNVTLSVKASITEGLSYQWYRQEPGSTTWSAFTSAASKTANFTFTAYKDNHGRAYKCVVKDANGGTIETEMVTLSVRYFVVQPQKATMSAANVPVQFSVEYSRSKGAKYQWELKYTSEDESEWRTTSQTGSKTNTLTYKTTNLKDIYEFRCKVTDTDGTVIYSDVARLWPDVGEAVIKNATTGQLDVVQGYYAFMNVEAEGSGVTYQWYISTDGGKSYYAVSSTDSAKTATLRVIGYGYRNGYKYKCRISTPKLSDKYEVWTDAVTLNVLPAAEFVVQPQDARVALGKTATFSVKVKMPDCEIIQDGTYQLGNGSGFTYQWQRSKTGANWNNIEGQTKSTLTLKGNEENARYFYRCVVTNDSQLSGGSIKSDPAKLIITE